MASGISNEECLPAGVYHEKQSRALCAVHALNNLFQDQYAFSKKDLDDICMNLAPNSYWMNPHRSMLGLGNYDVNVVMAALQLRNCDTLWFDKRKNLDDLDIARLRGLILNLPSSMRIGLIQIPVKRKHWIAICNLNGVYQNLDSKNKEPEKIGSEKDLKVFLRQHLDSKDTELLLVLDQSVDKDTLWSVRSVRSNGRLSPQAESKDSG